MFPPVGAQAWKIKDHFEGGGRPPAFSVERDK
jgi:hypothetical protein